MQAGCRGEERLLFCKKEAKNFLTRGCGRFYRHGIRWANLFASFLFIKAQIPVRLSINADQTDILSREPRGIGPGLTGAGAGCGALDCGVGLTGAMRIGGVLRLDDPIGAAKAEKDAAAIMSMSIITIP
jgi:hypothetical protein